MSFLINNTRLSGFHQNQNSVIDINPKKRYSQPLLKKLRNSFRKTKSHIAISKITPQKIKATRWFKVKAKTERENEKNLMSEQRIKTEELRVFLQTWNETGKSQVLKDKHAIVAKNGKFRVMVVKDLTGNWIDGMEELALEGEKYLSSLIRKSQLNEKIQYLKLVKMMSKCENGSLIKTLNEYLHILLNDDINSINNISNYCIIFSENGPVLEKISKSNSPKQMEAEHKILELLNVYHGKNRTDLLKIIHQIGKIPNGPIANLAPFLYRKKLQLYSTDYFKNKNINIYLTGKSRKSYFEILNTEVSFNSSISKTIQIIERLRKRKKITSAEYELFQSLRILKNESDKIIIKLKKSCNNDQLNVLQFSNIYTYENLQKTFAASADLSSKYKDSLIPVIDKVEKEILKTENISLQNLIANVFQRGPRIEMPFGNLVKYLKKEDQEGVEILDNRLGIISDSIQISDQVIEMLTA